MNTDPKKSALSCGCDEGASHQCIACAARGPWFGYKESQKPHPAFRDQLFGTPGLEVNHPQGSRVFGTDAQARKDCPIFTGGLMYFPDALAEVARISKKGNDQHNPGEPLHWAREKSTDQMDTAVRHMMDHGTGYTKDTDGAYHLGKAAWRILAELQLTIEQESK